MRTATRTGRTGPRNVRRYGARTRRWAAALGACFAAGSCDIGGAVEFREAARAQLETGVNALLDGLVDGAFAVFDPDETAAADATTTSGG